MAFREFRPMKTKHCSACGIAFGCGQSADGSGPCCWCASLPALMPLEAEAGLDCRCPACLKAVLQQRIEAYVQTITPETARGSIAPRYAGIGPLVEGIDYELNARGLMVFTKWYLLKQGTCCQSGCANCPYGYRAPATP